MRVLERNVDAVHYLFIANTMLVQYVCALTEHWISASWASVRHSQYLPESTADKTYFGA